MSLIINNFPQYCTRITIVFNSAAIHIFSVLLTRSIFQGKLQFCMLAYYSWLCASIYILSALATLIMGYGSMFLMLKIWLFYHCADEQLIFKEHHQTVHTCNIVVAKFNIALVKIQFF